MGSLRNLCAFSAVGAACAFLSWPAYANTSWDHNGSLMVLEENGKKRKLVYTEPRSTLDTAGVKRGTVLFDGEEKADGRLAGYAKLFRAGCDPVDYFVEGSLDTSKGEILLQGQAPIYSGTGCKITGYSDDNTASSLTFRQQGGGGGYASRNDPAQPDAGGGYSSQYAAPSQDPQANPDDPAYADPRADNERDFADPRDPRYNGRNYTDPRDPRYNERNYADRQPAYQGNDGYVLRPPLNPDDPDADSYAEDDEEDEPAYVPYRPFWRWGN
jgi:hypothetical protein